MVQGYPTTWLPRFLFFLTLALAVGLIMLVLAAPMLEDADIRSADLARALKLFAKDVTLRRTALASAFGLIVSACVFFRPPGLPRRLSSKKKLDPPPPSLAGA